MAQLLQIHPHDKGPSQLETQSNGTNKLLTRQLNKLLH